MNDLHDVIINRFILRFAQVARNMPLEENFAQIPESKLWERKTERICAAPGKIFFFFFPALSNTTANNRKFYVA